MVIEYEPLQAHDGQHSNDDLMIPVGHRAVSINRNSSSKLSIEHVVRQNATIGQFELHELLGD